MAEEDAPAVGSGTLCRKVIGVLIILFILFVGGALAYLGKGETDPWLGAVVEPFWGPLTIMEMVAVLSFGINFVAFVPAFAFQTEKFYDLTGTITYLSCTAYSYAAGYDDHVKVRPTVASALTAVWALRLGSFLFARILKDGKDDRFDAIKPNFVRFLATWMIQGLWVFLTAYAVFIINSSTAESSLNAVDVVGIVIWVVGFGIEFEADRQKRVWRANPDNKGKFIEYRLWYYSRHPNYFGEVTIWVGMFVLCASTLEGTQWTAIISPVFVFCLIYFVSGVRLLEKKADRKWGGQPDYENYKATTSVFVILPKLGKRTHQGASSDGAADLT